MPKTTVPALDAKQRFDLKQRYAAFKHFYSLTDVELAKMGKYASVHSYRNCLANSERHPAMIAIEIHEKFNQKTNQIMQTANTTPVSKESELFKSMKPFCVHLEDPSDENNSRSKDFYTLDEARLYYEQLKADLIHFTGEIDKSHWRDNNVGLCLELRHLHQIPVKEVENLIDAIYDGEYDLISYWFEMMHTYSERIETSITCYEGSELVQRDYSGPTYSTYFGSKPEMVAIADIEI